MKRFTFLKSLVMLFALCLLGTGAAWAQTEQTVTFDISSYGVRQGTSLADRPLTESPITITAGEGGNTPLRYWGDEADSHLRIYSGNQLIIAAEEGAQILEIVFNRSLTNFSASEGNLSGSTWSGNASSIIFTNNNTKGNTQISEINITYLPAAGFVAPPTFSLEEGTYNLGQSHELEITAGEGTTIYYALNGAATYTEYTRPIILNQTTTVSAYAQDADGNQSDKVEATYTFEAPSSTVYNKVTSIDELEEGAIYLIVAEGQGKALSAQDNTNYRSDASVEINDNSISTSVNASGLPYELTLGKDGDNYTFYDATSNGYLSLNKSDNQLHTSTTASGNAQWTITISGEETHLNSVAYSDREIRYNSSQPRFACYTGSQQPVTLYKKAAAATTGTFTIGKAGYATFFTDWTFVMPGGVEGGIVTGAADGNLTVDYCYTAGTVVPANTGLLLKGAAKTYTYDLSTETPDAPEVNYLKGSVDGGMTEGEGCLFYMLSYDQNNENLGFYWGAADGAAFKNGAGKAYLALPQAVASQVRGFVLDGTTTGISGVTTEANNAPAAVYSLTGVRMGTTTDNLPAGIYIVNGKKVLVK